MFMLVLNKVVIAIIMTSTMTYLFTHWRLKNQHILQVTLGIICGHSLWYGMLILNINSKLDEQSHEHLITSHAHNTEDDITQTS